MKGAEQIGTFDGIQGRPPGGGLQFRDEKTKLPPPELSPMAICSDLQNNDRPQPFMRFSYDGFKRDGLLYAGRLFMLYKLNYRFPWLSPYLQPFARYS